MSHHEYVKFAAVQDYEMFQDTHFGLKSQKRNFKVDRMNNQNELISNKSEECVHPYKVESLIIDKICFSFKRLLMRHACLNIANSHWKGLVFETHEAECCIV